MTGRLEGKIAFISGIGGGQGRVAAETFSAEGGVVVGCDIHPDAAAVTEESVRAAGGTIFATSAVDLSDPLQARRWIEDGIAAAGGIDILYNNAGAVRFGSVAETSDDDWAFTLRNELDLLFYCTRAAWPHLLARGGGSVINIASGSGLQGNMAGGASAHAAAKGGVIALSRQFAAEGAEHHIRSNSISPGVIETPSTAALRAKVVGSRPPFVPLGRLGRPEDIVYCALYLASDEAGWVTGANFIVDGGVTAVRPASGR
ncbi:SDR family NAD(P)-dependent oxidoreductase [Kribbella kalugense]|uniref:NAD(P)-dependent dehydrogenase (Short-subunit alcohol dehydrogenase family) n=1 Tax=Kribbella kalugense TaxID=2512221 RepID=A0A4R8A122_9ACTN|nr:SDR family NAD(P)-dependent oxidoreductase [Kribbella kalugense]TDW24197.1 NAD(P)-dependent dehydrogenase (short-subunit alcohol dehydrogenase family) [Kribbella kalugense]